MDFNKEIMAIKTNQANIAQRVNQLRGQVGVLMNESMRLEGELRLLNKLKEEQDKCPKDAQEVKSGAKGKEEA